jgi:hypothetical protein
MLTSWSRLQYPDSSGCWPQTEKRREEKRRDEKTREQNTSGQNREA